MLKTCFLKLWYICLNPSNTRKVKTFTFLSCLFLMKPNKSVVVSTHHEGHPIFNFELGLKIDNEILLVSHWEQEFSGCCSGNMLCLLI